MRKLRLLTIATVLALTVTAPAFAGITDTMPGAEPPPPSSSVQVNGIIETPPSATQEPTDPVVTVALEVLQIVISGF